jgi:ADP-ribose pyrophosphatase
LKKWDKLGSEPQGNFRVFSVRKQRNRSADSGKEGEFFVLDAANWVNVVALTPENEVVLVEQYRHGTDSLTLEIPGGCLDPGDLSPQAAARRELEEETGYSTDDWVELGCNDPNPAILSNRCYTYLARNVRLAKAQALDSMEEIAVHKVPLTEIPRLIRERKISHSLVIAGFYYFDLWKRDRDAR